MSVKNQKDMIIPPLESLFEKDDRISFYFLKKIKDIQNLMQKKTGDKNLRVIRWSGVIRKFVLASRFVIL